MAVVALISNSATITDLVNAHRRNFLKSKKSRHVSNVPAFSLRNKHPRGNSTGVFVDIKNTTQSSRNSGLIRLGGNLFMAMLVGARRNPVFRFEYFAKIGAGMKSA